MDTKLWKVNPDLIDRMVIRKAAALITEGEVVAFPTETVYGLGANGLDPAAVHKIFAAKGRPSDNPLILHIADSEALSQIAADVPPGAQALMERFWPGPLTIVFPKTAVVPDVVTGGLATVAVRMPAHPVARALIAAAGVPVAAPSANISGKPSPTSAEHVREDLAGRIAAIVDGGPAGIGLESTVVDLSTDVPYLLRPGGVSFEQIQSVLGEVRLAGKLEHDQTPKAPGMKYRHYAPEAPLYIVESPNPDNLANLMESLMREAAARGERPAAVVSAETAALIGEPLPGVLKVLGSKSDLAEVAHNLFGVLRELDKAGVSMIYAEGFAQAGLGAAVMNRLLKAAGGKRVTA